MNPWNLSLPPAVEMLIAEYRPLFTQPFNLRRYEADVARQAQQAEAQRAEVASAATLPLGSPLLTPIRCERLSVMAPEGSSPFSDCCATPLPASPVSLFLAATMEASGAPAGISPPFSPLAASPRQPPISLGLAAFQEPLAVHDTHDVASLAEDQHLEEAFSELLESTVSSMLFDLPLLPAADAALAAGAACAASPCEQPGSPVAVVQEAACDAGDSSDGSGGQPALAIKTQAGLLAAPHACRGMPFWALCSSLRIASPYSRSLVRLTACPQRVLQSFCPCIPDLLPPGPPLPCRLRCAHGLRPAPVCLGAPRGRPPRCRDPLKPAAATSQRRKRVAPAALLTPRRPILPEPERGQPVRPAPFSPALA